MRAEELRIGNLINRHFEGGQPDETVCTIRDIYDVSRSQLESDFKFSFSGISLTEDWLKRFGFKQGDNTIHNDHFWGINVGASSLGINPNNGVVWITTPADHSFNNPALIDYVHQLQNLYFALTGTELKLN